MIFGYKYTKVQTCEYATLSLEPKQYALFQANIYNFCAAMPNIFKQLAQIDNFYDSG